MSAIMTNAIEMMLEPPSPVRPAFGLMGRAAFHVFGRGTSPEALVPPMTWMLANGAVDETDAPRLGAAFARQLGPEWNGFAGASLVVRVLLLRAAACVHSATALARIDSYLMRMMQTPASLPKDMAILRKVATEHGNDSPLTEWINDIASSHGFERTVLVGMIGRVVRIKGIGAFSAEDMPWLAFVDRTSWVTVHSFGLRRHPAECAGVYSHHLIEHETGTAIREARVSGAIEGIQRAWRERLVFDAHEGEWIFAEGLHS